MTPRSPISPTRGGTLLALAALLAALSLLAGLASDPEAASAKSGKRTVLGKTKYEHEPNCGRKAAARDCTAEGKMTGYQVLQKGAKGRSFVVPYRKGKVVSWSIALSNPTRKEIEGIGRAQTPFFNNVFGSPAKARISVLRQVQKKKKGPPRYKMVRQSPVQTLNRYFGRTVHFALAKPLNVIKGQVVALTIPTWAPAFWAPRACRASSQGGYVDPTGCARAQREYTYRASRAPDKCELGYDEDDGSRNEALTKTRPQQKVGSVKRYGCYYAGYRLLYTATVVAR